MLDDTIAAISTPRGKGGVAMIRISGSDAFPIASRIFTPVNGCSLTESPIRKAIYGTIWAPDQTAASGWATVDTGLATLFKSPASFTGEDTVEICCHGGILLTETILAGVFAAGARPAEAGEFTRRAFINGKMGLDAAEALGSLLEATSREQIRISHTSMSGRLSETVRAQYDNLCHIMSSAYALIDFPDEDLSEMSHEEMITSLQSIENSILDLSSTYTTGHAVMEGIPTTICGRVNAGKSALYNQLVGHEAAIVTDIEGTTRDILESTVTAGKVTLRLSDTAGLRDTDDAVERIGIDRAKKQIADSELVLLVIDGSKPLTHEDMEWTNLIYNHVTDHGCHVILVINKSDLPTVIETEQLQLQFGAPVFLSAQTGEGLLQLIVRIEELYIDGQLNANEDAIVSNARQYGALIRAKDAVHQALDALHANFPMDLVSESIELAMRELCQVNGQQVSDDVVSGIFSHFCVGK